MAEQFLGAGYAVKDGVAVGVEARGGASCVLSFLEEYVEGVAHAACRGVVRRERTERLCEELTQPLLVAAEQCDDFDVSVGD